MAKLLVLESYIVFRKDKPQQSEYNGRNFYYVEGAKKIKTIRKENEDKDGTFSLYITNVYEVEEGQEFVIYNYFNEWYEESTASGSYRIKFKVEGSEANPIEIYDLKLTKEDATEYVCSNEKYIKEKIDWENQYYFFSSKFQDETDFEQELHGDEAIQRILALEIIETISFDLKDNTEEVLKKLAE